MNNRIRKKKDKQAIDLAKKIIYYINWRDEKKPTFWKVNSETKKSDMKYGKPYYDDARYNFHCELQAKEMLLKTCRKCLTDKFPLEEYSLFEIPYQDENGWVLVFVNEKDYEECHILGNKNKKIREIDFWCTFNKKMAIPQRLEGSNQYDCNNCWDSVFDD